MKNNPYNNYGKTALGREKVIEVVGKIGEGAVLQKQIITEEDISKANKDHLQDNLYDTKTYEASRGKASSELVNNKVTDDNSTGILSQIRFDIKPKLNKTKKKVRTFEEILNDNDDFKFSLENYLTESLGLTLSDEEEFILRIKFFEHGAKELRIPITDLTYENLYKIVSEEYVRVTSDNTLNNKAIMAEEVIISYIIEEKREDKKQIDVEKLNNILDLFRNKEEVMINE